VFECQERAIRKFEFGPKRRPKTAIPAVGGPKSRRNERRSHQGDGSGEVFSKTVLTAPGGAAYKPPIETAPPLSGASSALH
jgi:hypothetical protein